MHDQYGEGEACLVGGYKHCLYRLPVQLDYVMLKRVYSGLYGARIVMAGIYLGPKG